MARSPGRGFMAPDALAVIHPDRCPPGVPSGWHNGVLVFGSAALFYLAAEARQREAPGGPEFPVPATRFRAAFLALPLTDMATRCGEVRDGRERCRAWHPWVLSPQCSITSAAGDRSSS